VIRAATPEDLPALTSLHLASARAAYSHIGPVDKLEPRDWAPDLAVAKTALVAVDDDAGEVAGFAFVGGCELQFFYTHPRVWGRGFGRSLLAAAEDALRDAGCTEAVLNTEERNHRALRAYEAAGWIPDGTVRERDWLGVPIREPRLVKRLA
jgi:GNAT superfamily N-acetyltransferase